MLKKKAKRYRRHKRVRAKIFGTKEKPRLCVFRSAKHIYVQLIDDEKGKTLAAASDQEIKKGKKSKIEIAKAVGKLIAKKALEKTTTRPPRPPTRFARGPLIEKVVFDRGGYQYHGRVKALAEGAREGGLKF